MATELYKDPRIETCVVAAQVAERACLDALSLSLARGGELASPELLGLLLDTADVCPVAVRFLVRGSELQGRMAAAVAEICQRASEVCAVFQDEPALQQCTEGCREAAEAFRELAYVEGLVGYDEVVEESFPASDPPPGPGSGRYRR
jgi:hypothetical protein